MNREAFVRAIVIGVRTQMETKYPVTAEKVRSMREQAEGAADTTEELDDIGQQVFAGMCAKLGHVPQGDRLATFRDEAKILSDVLNAPPTKTRGQIAAPVDPEHDQFKKEIARDIMIRVRSNMDVRHRLSKEQGAAILRDAEEMAEEFIAQELDPDTREVVVGMCAHLGVVVKAQQLASFIEQGKIVSNVLATPFKPSTRR